MADRTITPSLTRLPVVREFMATKLKTLTPDVPILEAVRFLLDNKISGAPVVDGDGTLVGILSEKDCLGLVARGVDNEPPEGAVGDFMTSDVMTVPSKMDIYYCAGLFLKNVYRRLPVVDGGKLVGQVSRRDVLRAMQSALP